MMTESVLHVSGLNKRIGKRQILSDVSFELQTGETLGLIGSNGAGKTSILKCLTGLWKPDGGEIRILGKNIAEDFIGCMQSTAAIVGYPNLFGHLTLRQNIEYVSAFLDAVDPSETDRLLELLDLKAFQDAKIKTFSSGMHQKACLAIAFLRKPRLLLLDEPTSMLDPKSAAEIRSFLETQRASLSILISSHNLHEVEKLCDKAIIVERGRCIQTIDLNDNSLTQRYVLVFRDGDAARLLFEQAKDEFKLSLMNEKLSISADAETLRAFMIRYRPQFLRLCEDDKLERDFLTTLSEEQS